MKSYTVAIIGSGVTGSALLYTLAKYTNITKIVLLEKYAQIATVQSAKNNNSQTLHVGDIETHYSPQKAKKVKEAADPVRVYALKHGEHLYKKVQKMALAVGDEEVKALRARHEAFSRIFPDLRLIERDELARVEPKVVQGRDEKIKLLAAFSEDGYAINYGALAESFVKEAKKERKTIDILLSTKVTGLKRENDFYRVKTNKGEIQAQVVVVAASANTLTFAHKLGYGKDLILLPVAGDFFCTNKLLNGKVYMMQNPKLPFAAIHGDPDVEKDDVTRFGPIAKVFPVLEKRNPTSFFDFLRLFHLRWSAFASIFTILKDPTYFRYVFWNVLYSVPFIGRVFFLREVRKIVPSIKARELHYGSDIGGIRPQIVDTKTRKVNMGEAKILGEHIIFNITPSPGASVCLDNAQKDARHIINFLGEKYVFDQKQFDKELREEKD